MDLKKKKKDEITRREKIKGRINVSKTRKQELEYSNHDKDVMKNVRRDYR